MADIELVIKINEDYFNHLKSIKFGDYEFQIYRAVQNGIPLPKGHGRLIDEKDLSLMTVHMVDGMFVCDAPTIIEADKEYEAKVITRGNCMMCGKELTEGLFFCKECGDKASKRK